MEILGQGHKGIVIADGDGTVQKFYSTEAEWSKEQTHLAFLNDIQAQGFDIGCTIPKLLEVIGHGSWEVNGKTYNYCNRIERVPGRNARQIATDLSRTELATLGRGLGATAFAMHFAGRAFIEQWKQTFGSKNNLLDHILRDKAGKVLREETEPRIKRAVERAASYLESERSHLAQEATLSHSDFTLSNTQIAPDGLIYGLVDWGSFGLTSPSLSLYQLVPNPIWPHVRQEYERQGGVIREDIIFAAAAVHLAWSPLINKQLGLPIDEEEIRENFEAMYKNFETYSQA